MEAEKERAALAADYPNWRVWRNTCNPALVYAWRRRSSPPLVLKAATVEELREQLVARGFRPGEPE